MRPRRTLRVAAVLLALASIALAAPALRAQGVAEEMERVRGELADAREASIPYLAPGAFATAEEALSRAARLRRTGDADAGAVLEALSRARRALARADSVAPRARPMLGPGLAARATALEAGAEERAPEAWRSAEETLREAGRAVEEGEPGDARGATGDAVRLYRRAALRALESPTLAAVRALRDSAAAAEARRRAPRSRARADSLLARARRELERAVAGAAGGGRDAAVDSAALAAARASADSALGLYRRSVRLARRADSVRSTEGAFEAAALRYEREAARIARHLGVDVDLSDGTAGEVEAILAAIDRRGDTVAALRARLDSVRAEARSAAGRVDSIAGRVASLEGRIDSLATRLGRRLQRERRIREVRALFSGEEGSVRVAGDTVELRLPGLAFEPGESELPADADPLLTKVRSALRAFPGAEILVEGHTDARGDEAANRALSQQRAIAVRDHLLLHLPITADRIAAVGRGETRPVASNDTEEGRARNRRIEVVLALPPVNAERAGPAPGARPAPADTAAPADTSGVAASPARALRLREASLPGRPRP